MPRPPPDAVGSNDGNPSPPRTRKSPRQFSRLVLWRSPMFPKPESPPLHPARDHHGPRRMAGSTSAKAPAANQNRKTPIDSVRLTRPSLPTLGAPRLTRVSMPDPAAVPPVLVAAYAATALPNPLQHPASPAGVIHRTPSLAGMPSGPNEILPRSISTRFPKP